MIDFRLAVGKQNPDGARIFFAHLPTSKLVSSAISRNALSSPDYVPGSSRISQKLSISRALLNKLINVYHDESTRGSCYYSISFALYGKFDSISSNFVSQVNPSSSRGSQALSLFKVGQSNRDRRLRRRKNLSRQQVINLNDYFFQVFIYSSYII